MAHRYHTRREIEFSDTDMAGIVHFANFFRFMETAEHQFFRSLGFVVHHRDGDTTHGWVRVDARCEYDRPLRYLDVVEIELLVREKSRKSILYEFTFRRVRDRRGEVAPEIVARGRMRVVRVIQRPGETMHACDMPEEVDAAVDVAPDELLNAKD
jgi:YbgC/YbaW family acyl-CoA thioester hydrolase